MKQHMGTSISSWFKGVNHWSFGIAFLGILFSVSPSLMEPGVGLSAVGVAFFAAHRGRYPAWCVLCLLPCLGAIVALIALATLKPFDRTETEPLSFMRKLIRHPLLFAIPLLVGSIFVWKYQNPSSTEYQIRAYNHQARADARDLLDMVKNYMTSYQQYPSSFHPREGRVELFSPPRRKKVPDISMKKKLRKNVWIALKTSVDGKRFSLAAKHVNGNKIFLSSNKDNHIHEAAEKKPIGYVLSMDDVPEPLKR